MVIKILNRVIKFICMYLSCHFTCPVHLIVSVEQIAAKHVEDTATLCGAVSSTLALNTDQQVHCWQVNYSYLSPTPPVIEHSSL